MGSPNDSFEPLRSRRSMAASSIRSRRFALPSGPLSPSTTPNGGLRSSASKHHLRHGAPGTTLPTYPPSHDKPLSKKSGAVQADRPPRVQESDDLAGLSSRAS